MIAMIVQKLFGNFSLRLCLGCPACIGAHKNAWKLLCLSALKLSAICLLMLSTICFECSLTKRVAFGEQNAQFIIDNSENNFAIYDEYLKPIVSCLKSDYGAGQEYNKSLLCFNTNDPSDSLSPNIHGVYIPEGIFTGGDQREGLACIFKHYNEYENNAGETARLALYDCQRNQEDSKIYHAIYYADELGERQVAFSNTLLSGHIEQTSDGSLCYPQNGVDLLGKRNIKCINPELYQRFLAPNIKDGKLLLSDVSKDIEKDISHVEDEDGKIKPWPFSKTIHVQKPRGGSFIIDADVCQLDGSSSNILGAKYTCLPSVAASLIATVGGPLGCCAVLASTGIAGALSVIQSLLDEVKITSNVSKIINQGHLNTTKTLQSTAGLWQKALSFFKESRLRNNVLRVMCNLPASMESQQILQTITQ